MQVTDIQVTDIQVTDLQVTDIQVTESASLPSPAASFPLSWQRCSHPPRVGGGR